MTSAHVDRRASWARLALVASLAPAAWMAVGAPDVVTAAEFFANPYPTYASAYAAIRLVLWVLVAALLIAEVKAAWPRRGARPRGRLLRPRPYLVVALGLAIFLGGLGRHSTGVPPLCCGSLPQASELAR